MLRAAVSPDPPPAPSVDAAAAPAPSAPPVGVPVARPEACANCEAPLAGEFCHRCGQRRVRPDDLSAPRALRRLAEELTDLDGKVFRTLRALVARPGHLTAEYLAGRRDAYLSPVKLFIVATAVFFLAGWDALFAIQDVRSQLAAFPPYVADVVDEGPRAAALFEVWVDRAGDLFGWLRIANVFLLAVLLRLLFLRRRTLLGEHLTFALHYYAFDLVATLGLVAVLWGPATTSAGGVPPQVLPLLQTVVVPVYLWLAVRRVHGTGWKRTTAVAASLFGADLLLSNVASWLAIGLSHALTYGG